MASRALKGMRDLRGMHTVIRRSGPTEGPAAYVDMLRLMTEKARLERELIMWQANVQRIQTRLADIETQMQQLDEITARERSKGDSAAQEETETELTLTY
jgi:hypothetical protein